MSAARIAAYRSHEDQTGPYFDIEPEDADEYAARPFVKLVSSDGETITTAHDLFEFKPDNARRLAASWNALRHLSIEEIEKMEG